jgi:hypothetical protein
MDKGLSALGVKFLGIIPATELENKMNSKRSQLIYCFILLIDLYSSINDFVKLGKGKCFKRHVFFLLRGKAK